MVARLGREIVLMVCCLTLCTPAVSARRSEHEPPVPERQAWTVGTMEFDVPDQPGPPEQADRSHDEFLSTRVPFLLLEYLSGLESRVITRNESDLIRRETLDKAIRDEGQTLAVHIESRSEIMFGTAGMGDQEDQYRNTTEKVQESRRRLAYLRELDPKTIDVEDALPLRFESSGTRLLSRDISPAAHAETGRYDSILYGTVARLDKYLYIEVKLYNRLSRDLQFQGTVLSLPEELEKRLAGIVGPLAEALLGRPWASVTVSVSDPAAIVYLNNTYKGLGRGRLLWVEPGPVEIQVYRAGRFEYTGTVNLAPLENRQVEVALPDRETTGMIATTDPRGAGVYIDSVWRGYTPVVTGHPDRTTIALLTKPGYLSSRFPVDHDTPLEVDRALVPAEYDPAGKLIMKRDRFYRALGWFVLSLPIPIIFDGLYGDLGTFLPPGSERQDLDPDVRDNLARRREFYRSVTWGGTALSSVLFVNTMVRLGQYIREAEAYRYR
jgi:hypothetical protein